MTPGARGSRWDEALRVATIDVSAARAAVTEEGLGDGWLTDITVLTERRGLALARPIAMFIDQSDENTIGAAIDAGVSACVVDGLRRERIKPILDLATTRSMPSRVCRPSCMRRARHAPSTGRWTGRRRS